MHNSLIVGTVIAFGYSHTSHGIDYNEAFVECRRLSGYKDIIPIVYKADIELQVGCDFKFIGDIRSRRENANDGHKTLLIYIMAKEIYSVPGAIHENEIDIHTHLCQIRQLRETSYGGNIIDVMLVHKSESKKNVYMPAIAWNKVARIINRKNLGDKIHVQCRFQSRDYEKDGETYTALELSIYKLINDEGE